jgi:hypothetical protein
VPNKLRYKHAFYPLQPTSVNHNPLTPELNPSAQRCLARFSTADFASLTVYFVNIYVKNQQMKQLFIQFINPLGPSDPYMGRTAQLTSRSCILNTYSTNIHTEYFNMVHNLRSFLFKMPFIS